MPLKVVAVSAPEFQLGRPKDTALTSGDPFSLFNACRMAADLADRGKAAWGDSNWAGSREDRRKRVLLMRSIRDDFQKFEELLRTENPNLLLLGSMTLSFPGAIECAKRAKAILGDRVCVVLGGAHACETIYHAPGTKKVRHHSGSPLSLMQEGKIEPVFDFAISGAGEAIISAIGKVVDRAPAGCSWPWVFNELADMAGEIPGKWILGQCHEGRIETLSSVGLQLDYDSLPSPSLLFGIGAAFPVFSGRVTAHVISDTGRGCAYDCDFCSERRSIAGSPTDINKAANRLYRHLQNALQVAAQDHPSSGASAFVEDPTILSGSRKQIRRLISLLQDDNLDIQFGGQLTIDQITNLQVELEMLRTVGMSYLFVGLETPNPGMIGGFHKDLGRKQSPWMERAEQAFDFLSEVGYTCGISLLFGLGETRDARLGFLDQILDWKVERGYPAVVSANWAVQHPLRGDDHGSSFDYIEWGTPQGPMLDAFLHFGEASVLYPIAGQAPPELEEVEEIVEFLNVLKAQPMGGWRSERIASGHIP